MTSQKLHEEHEILRRFMAVVVSSAFRDSLMNAADPNRGDNSREPFSDNYRSGFAAVRFGHAHVRFRSRNCYLLAI